jgi:hypothetical protein
VALAYGPREAGSWRYVPVEARPTSA